MNRRIHSSAGVVAATVALSLFCSFPGRTDQPRKGGETMSLTITSPAFQPGGTIPAKYTCDGANISPPLKWTGVPPGTKSLALICDDPDAPAGTWVHWVLYN